MHLHYRAVGIMGVECDSFGSKGSVPNRVVSLCRLGNQGVYSHA